MLPSQEPLAAQISLEAGALLTGDLGLVALRAMLENGVGYVVSSWIDRPTPIDAAIDDARDAVLARRGIVLRRLRAMSALEQVVMHPPARPGQPAPRGVVLFAGRRGLRPTLEAFSSLKTPGGVVGICFDDEAARCEAGIVIDPEPSARGLVAALDAAFAASTSSGSPVLVLVRERLLGMRGTIRCRPQLTAEEAAALDAGTARCADAEEAAAAGGLVRVELAPQPAAAESVLVVPSSIAGAARRSLSLVAAALAMGGARPVTDGVALVETAAAGAGLSASPAADVLGAASAILVVCGRGEPLTSRVERVAGSARISTVALDLAETRGEQLVAALASWLVESSLELDERTTQTLEQLVRDPSRRPSDPRVPRRDDLLHRAVPAPAAAGLALAQGVIGVPARMAASHPTYRTDAGVPLTVVPAELFVAEGAACAAPGAENGLYVVSGNAPGVTEAAAALGASIEHVDAGSPRAVGAAVARSCLSWRSAAHVIILTAVQRVGAPAAAIGVDPDLLGTDRLATSALPADATAFVELDDQLLAGPAQVMLDTPEAAAALEPLRALTPATWELRRGSRSGSSRISDAAWSLRRRLVRSAAGVEL